MNKLLLLTKNLEKVVCPRKSCLVTTKLQNQKRGSRWSVVPFECTKSDPEEAMELCKTASRPRGNDGKIMPGRQESMDRRTQTGRSKRLLKLSLVRWGNNIQRAFGKIKMVYFSSAQEVQENL